MLKSRTKFQTFLVEFWKFALSVRNPPTVENLTYLKKNADICPEKIDFFESSQNEDLRMPIYIIFNTEFD